MKKLFLIIGAPGSGKTTDASLIAQEDAKFAHFSTGDLLRAEVASGSELGKLIDGFISKGNLVPLDVVVNGERAIEPIVADVKALVNSL